MRSRLPVDLVIGGVAAAVVLGLGLLVLPRLAFPLLDEVFYVGPTVWLAETGQLVMPAAITTSFVALAAWGAVFVKLFGGSFVTLRLAALVASALSAVAFYALLRYLGFDRVRCVLTLSILILNPLYLSSSVIFLTESLFVLLVLCSLIVGLLGLRRGQGLLLLASGALAGAAFLTRQIGICVAVALAAGLLASPRLRRSPGPWLLLLVPPALTVAAYLLWSSELEDSGSRWYFANTVTAWTQELRPTHVGRRVNLVLPYLGLFTLPLLLAHAPALLPHLARLPRRGKAALAGGLLLVTLGFIYEWTKGLHHFPYLRSTLDPRGLFMPDFTVVAQWPPAPWLVAATLVLWAAAGIVVGLTASALPRSPGAWWRHPHLPLYLTGALLALASISPYFLTDRYLLPWLPFALIAVLAVMRTVRPSLPLATAVVAASAALSVALMLDYNERAALRWDIARTLAQDGIPVHDIAASWEWHSWWNYWQVYHVGDPPPREPRPSGASQDAHNALHAVERNRDTRRDIDRPYRIASLPESGYEIERVYSYWSPLAWKTRPLYVLHTPAAY
jgi:4-amino-4-deoxy-L-arabinose transferase-like glycosyltransferase